MDFDWYKEIWRTDDLTQGDIINNCYIPIPNTAIYDAIISKSEDVEESINIESADLIILSQACDIANEKIQTLVMCPVWSLNDLMELNDFYKSAKGKESLRQGKEPAYHLINNYESENIKLEYSIIDFHQIYSLPKEYLKKCAIDKKYRLRLLPPYREHLSQAFARYFMRVGLPQDIDKESIKNYKPINAT